MKVLVTRPTRRLTEAEYKRALRFVAEYVATGRVPVRRFPRRSS